MKLSSDQLSAVRADIERTGYAIVRDVVPDDLLDRLISTIRDLMATTPPDKRNTSSTEFKGSSTHTLRNILSKGSVFEEAVQHVPVQQVAEAILGDGFA